MKKYKLFSMGIAGAILLGAASPVLANTTAVSATGNAYVRFTEGDVTIISPSPGAAMVSNLDFGIHELDAQLLNTGRRFEHIAQGYEAAPETSTINYDGNGNIELIGLRDLRGIGSDFIELQISSPGFVGINGAEISVTGLSVRGGTNNPTIYNPRRERRYNLLRNTESVQINNTQGDIVLYAPISGISLNIPGGNA
ncbi:MAG: hypothetical protein LBV67_02675, partial [Streptococcaceae bacterium]|nr:hypothetical protein [Streptococcaceae bacterium]